MNPLREIFETLSRRAADRPSPFRAEADAALAGFRRGRDEIESGVKRGDLTLRVARERAAALAKSLHESLNDQAARFDIAPRAFLDRLIEADERRKERADRAPLDVLQRETNRLLRSVLVEQQLQARRAEFEGRAFVRPVSGGQPAPTLDSLIEFHRSAVNSGDDAAAEWARRQLEAQRPLATGPEAIRAIDRETDRPDRVNPSIVAAYVESLAEAGPDELERYVAESLASRDANACLAAFALARQSEEGPRARWVRMVLDGVDSFPEVALTTLRSLEVAARESDREAAMAQVDLVTAQARTDAKLTGLEAPTAVELGRRAAAEARPLARVGEPIGLTLDRRGVFDGEEPVSSADNDL